MSRHLFAAVAAVSPLILSSVCLAQAPSGSEALRLAARAEAELAERVVFDQPGDGRLWAAGRSWKMSFGAEGATYYPFLGSDAPRNFPLGMRLIRATAGGSAVPLEPAGPAIRRGDRVEISHGGLVESYRLEPRAVEQLFELAERPGAGDLVLELALETELSRAEVEGGLRFEGAYGTVSYTQAVAIDARGTRCELATRLTPDGVSITVPADFADGAEWPLLVDPVITTIDISEANFDEAQPDVAWDETNGRYAVVWERVFSATDTDVVARYFDGDSNAPIAGTLQFVDSTSEDWQNPSVANAATSDTFLFVAERGAQGSQAIWGRVRGAHSNVSGAQFKITDLSGHHIHPVVGGGRTPNLPAGRFLVVWERVRNASDRDIWGQVVRGDGTLFGGHIPIESTTQTYDVNPAISKNKGGQNVDWTVVWQRDLNVSNSDVLGARVRTDGVVSVPTFEIDGFSTLTDFPVVSTPFADSEHYLVAYRALVFGKYEIFCRLYQGTSTSPIEALTITTNDGSPDSSKSRPYLDASDCRFVLTYSESQNAFDSDVFATSMSLNGNDLVIEEGYVYLGGGGELASPAPIASTGHGSGLGQRFLAAWDQFNPFGTDNDVYGTVFAPVGTIDGCDPQPGIAYCFGQGCPCGNDSPLSGCVNSTGVGALLVADGTASISADDLSMTASGMVSNQPALLFSADNAVGGGAGIPFGDGLRCAAGDVLRLGTQTANAFGATTFGPGLISEELAPASGDQRRYQCWYRDPIAGPCGGGFNLTSAYEVTFTL